MKKEEKLLIEEAPPDNSTYFEGEPASNEKSPDAEGIEEFPFVYAIRRENENE